MIYIFTYIHTQKISKENGHLLILEGCFFKNCIFEIANDSDKILKNFQLQSY